VKVAVLSDVHANLHALEAVLADIDRKPPDAIWCLGDVVGYGPQPNRCCFLVAQRTTLCLGGNHDLAVVGTLPIEDFNGDAAAAVRWTQKALDENARGFLEGLAPSATREGISLYHGSPLDPVWDYILTEATAEAAFRFTEDPLILVGHSHVPLALSFDGSKLTGGIASAGVEQELGGSRWLLNPGSVGQPRGDDPRAAWLLLDLVAMTASFRRTEYDVEATQREIVAAGLPESLATRLGAGQ
jgi:predicted phosphodiesterase